MKTAVNVPRGWTVLKFVCKDCGRRIRLGYDHTCDPNVGKRKRKE